MRQDTESQRKHKACLRGQYEMKFEKKKEELIAKHEKEMRELTERTNKRIEKARLSFNQSERDLASANDRIREQNAKLLGGI